MNLILRGRLMYWNVQPGVGNSCGWCPCSSNFSCYRNWKDVAGPNGFSKDFGKSNGLWKMWRNQVNVKSISKNVINFWKIFETERMLKWCGKTVQSSKRSLRIEWRLKRCQIIDLILRGLEKRMNLKKMVEGPNVCWKNVQDLWILTRWIIEWTLKKCWRMRRKLKRCDRIELILKMYESNEYVL